MSKKKTKAPVVPASMWLVVQQGGSTREMYASLYDTEKDASKAKRGHEKATYSAFGPIEVPGPLAEVLRSSTDAECKFVSLLSEVASEAIGLA